MEKRTYWLIAVVAVVVIAGAVWFKYMRASGYNFDTIPDAGMSSVNPAYPNPFANR